MVTVAPAAVRVSGRWSRASAARTRRKDLPRASGRSAAARDSAMYCGRDQVDGEADGVGGGKRWLAR